MSAPEMTYGTAVAELKRLRGMGVEDVHNPELFKAYESGVTAISLLCDPLGCFPTPYPEGDRHLMFKDIRVWER